MTDTHKHVVCFAPYTDWSIHSARQVTILHALRQRGASVSYVTCDGVFSDCDLFQKATGATKPRDANSCLVCQASVASRLAAWSMPFRWLGSWLSTPDRTAAGAWVASLKPEDYATAQYKSWDIGAWVMSSVRTELRCSEFDFGDANTARVYASHLYSGALAAIGLDRLFTEEAPDLQILFNGRMAPTRIALEIARRHGVRTLCEERSAVAGRMLLFENVNCLDVSHVDELWDAWKDTPLTTDEAHDIWHVLSVRRGGGSGEVSVFSRGHQNEDEVRKALDLSADRPVWVLFTSSVDEIADKANVESIFPNQTAWLDATMAYARGNPDLQIVVRVHPNVGGERALGENTGEVQYFKNLERLAPGNVRIVQPGDDISSYTLATLCDAALVWYSTIGVETAALGKPVVRAGGFLLENRDFIKAPESPGDYPALLDDVRAGISAQEQLNIAAGAWRFAHIWFLRRSIPFPLVDQPEWHTGSPRWTSPTELVPGADSNLDRICDVCLSGAALHPGPAADRSGTHEAERAFIAEHLQLRRV